MEKSWFNIVKEHINGAKVIQAIIKLAKLEGRDYLTEDEQREIAIIAIREADVVEFTLGFLLRNLKKPLDMGSGGLYFAYEPKEIFASYEQILIDHGIPESMIKWLKDQCDEKDTSS